MTLRSVKYDEREVLFNPNLVFYADLAKHDGTSFMSDDGAGHLLTVTGATWGLQGRTFDGTDDNINCGDKATFDPGAGNFTLIGWAKSDVANDATDRRIVSKQVANEQYILRKGQTGVWQAYFQSGAGVEANPAGTNVLSINTWYMVTGLRNGTTCKVYLNGGTEEATATNASLTDINPTGSALYISGYQGGVSENWKGTIGEVWIYNRALLPSEIQNIYLATRWRYQ